MAAVASSALPEGTVASDAPVAGLKTSKVSPERDSTHLPSMNTATSRAFAHFNKQFEILEDLLARSDRIQEAIILIGCSNSHSDTFIFEGTSDNSRAFELLKNGSCLTL